MEVSGTTFSADFKVLPLDCYDAIIGTDWLQKHGPMRVDWVEKWIMVPVAGTERNLKRVSADLSSCE
jgi:hypothetical protein